MTDSSRIVAWIVGIVIVGLIVWAIAASYSSTTGSDYSSNGTGSEMYSNTDNNAVDNTNSNPNSTGATSTGTNLNVNASGNLNY
jgi:hypothetical protein